MKIIDISIPIDGKIPLWPGTLKPKSEKVRNLNKGGLSNDSQIKMGVHTGTHIDAPLHFIRKGKTIEELPLDCFFGPALVIYLPKITKITARDLQKLTLPKGIKRLLFKTRNSSLWNKGISKFRKNYAGLTEDAAIWLTRRKIKLVGMDYLSIATFNDITSVHKILLGKEVVILEGINLAGVRPGGYNLACFPIKLSGLEAAPVRAVLIKN